MEAFCRLRVFFVGANTSSGATDATMIPDSTNMDIPHVVAATAK